jgi:hypothetical protein
MCRIFTEGKRMAFTLVGSVKGVKSSVDLTVLIRLAVRNDRQAINSDDL